MNSERMNIMDKFCSGCSDPLKPDAKFCPNCGAMVNAAPTSGSDFAPASAGEKNLAAGALAVKNIIAGSVAASGTAGELVLPGALPVLSSFGGGESLSAVLQDGLRKLLKGTKTVLADKKRLFLAVSLALIWLVLNLFGRYGLFPLPVWLLSWLTAARGGLIGGSVGKGLVAALFARLLTDKGMMSSLKNGLGRLKAMGEKEDWPSLLLGGGVALIIANLLVASTLQNSMVALAALFHSLLALRENGFLYRLFSALLPQRDNRTIGLIMQGWALGFLLFTGLCLLPGRANGYLGGFLLLVAFVVLKFWEKDKKEVAAG